MTIERIGVEEQVANPGAGAVLRELRLLRAQLHNDMMDLAQAAEDKVDDVFFLPIVGTTQRILASKIIILPANAVNGVVRIGTWDAIYFEATTNGSLELPFPHVIEPGTRVSLVATGTGQEFVMPDTVGLLSAYLIGQAEEARVSTREPNLIDS